MLNKVILIGNLGKDPEVRHTPSGTAVATFPIATSEKFKDRDGNKQERTEWHNIVAWRQLADICGKYLQKGKQVYIEGKIQTRSYDDKDGQKRYITEIVADQMQMLGSAPGNDQRSQQYQQPQQPQQQQPQQQQPQQQQPQQQQPQQQYPQQPPQQQGGYVPYDPQSEEMPF